MTQKRLSFDQSLVAQEQYWDCGPASAQILLSIRGKFVSENQLIKEIGTTVNGTNTVEWVEKVLDQRLPEAQYTSVFLPNDPISADQKTALWDRIVAAIDSGYGVLVNIDAPYGNHPIGVLGSTSPNYGTGEILHYITVIGYDDVARAVLLGDPGFSPFIYWITFDQLATLIPPKGYAYPAGGDSIDVQAVTDFIKTYVGPLISDVSDVRTQLCGAAKSYPGWAQLGNKTVVDGLADFRNHLARLS